MKKELALVFCALLLANTPAPTLLKNQIAAVRGDIVVHDARGKSFALTSGGGFIEPTLSTDGKQAAFIKVAVAGEPGMGTSRTSLWIADIATRTSRQLLASTPADAMTENLSAMSKPQFSPDGSFVYVMAEAWQTSNAIHQVNVKTGQHRFFTDGDLMFILTSGRFRGSLLVMKHVYVTHPEPGAYNAVFVYPADTRRSFMIPGSDKDEGDKSLPAWLRKFAAH
ncbi:MAG: hypothetical protein RL367_2609 [Pseudomonadota bacterium]|jgi:dipeptidyl aminopeptidase/acylaminoacyl peptidase